MVHEIASLLGDGRCEAEKELRAGVFTVGALAADHVARRAWIVDLG